MARYKGPRVRISRRFGTPIFGPSKYFERRNYPPERVAAAVLKAVRKNRGLVPVSPEARLAWYFKRFAPGLFGRLARRDLV